MIKILSILLLLPFCSFSQIQTDTAFGKITGFSEVVKIDTMTKQELYNNAKKWFAYTFQSSKSVIELDDKDAGLLVGKGNFDFYPKGGNNGRPLTIRFIVTVNLKDNKYKCELNGFNGILYLFGGNEKDFFPSEKPKKKFLCSQCPTDWEMLTEKFKSIISSLKLEMQKRTADF